MNEMTFDKNELPNVFAQHLNKTILEICLELDKSIIDRNSWFEIEYKTFLEKLKIAEARGKSGERINQEIDEWEKLLESEKSVNLLTKSKITLIELFSVFNQNINTDTFIDDFRNELDFDDSEEKEFELIIGELGRIQNILSDEPDFPDNYIANNPQFTEQYFSQLTTREMLKFVAKMFNISKECIKFLKKMVFEIILVNQQYEYFLKLIAYKNEFDGKEINNPENTLIPNFSKSQWILVYHYFFSTHGALQYNVSDYSIFAKFIHLVTGTEFTKIQNSDIYKKLKQAPNFNGNKKLHSDLNIILPFFKKIEFADICQLIENEINMCISATNK